MRKFFLFAAALCCAVMINAQEIGTWSGFCKGAASFTFEGGAPSHSSDGASLFNKYRLSAKSPAQELRPVLPSGVSDNNIRISRLHLIPDVLQHASMESGALLCA